MAIDEDLRLRQDSEDPSTILWWDDYAKADGRPISDYLLETGERAVPLGTLTVPAREYTSREFHQREVEQLWTKTWQVACRENDIPQVGDYLEYEIVGHSILVVRDTPDTIKAFRNACRHRATAVAEGHGNVSTFMCPFHGWTYGLDGSLRNIPACWDFSHVDRSKTGLLPVQAETFDGWVYVNLDPDAVPLREFLGETVCRHLQVHPNEHMWKAYHAGTIVRSNWKVMLEAFLEVYHTATTHPTLIAYGSDVQARYDAFGLHARMIAPVMVGGLVGGAQFTEQEIVEEALGYTRSFQMAGENPDVEQSALQVPDGVSARQFMAGLIRMQAKGEGIELDHISDTELIDAVIYLVFPNLTPFRSPAGHWVYRYRPNGDDPESCIYEVMHLVPLPPGKDRPKDAQLQMLPEGVTLADCQKEMGELGFLLNQDVDNCAKIQKGMRVIDEIVLGERQEANIVAFHRTLNHVMDANEARRT